MIEKTEKYFVQDKLVIHWHHIALMFMYFYVPFINIHGVNIRLPYVFEAVLILSFILILHLKRVPVELFLLVGLYMIGFFWVRIISVLNATDDINFFLIHVNGAISILSAYVITSLFYNRYGKTTSQVIIYAIFLSGIIHAIIMVSAFFIEPFRVALYSIVPLNERGERFVNKMVRSPGLTSGSSFSLAIFQASTLIFGLIFLLNVKTKIGYIRLGFYLLGFILLLVSVFLSARVGLIVVSVGVLMVVFEKILNSKLIYIKKYTVKKFATIILLSAVLIPILVVLILKSPYQIFANRAFEIFINYVESGEIYTTSTNTLKEMFFLPNNSSQTVIGDGNFGRDESLPYIRSDVGYVRLIHGAGILGTFFIFLWLLYVIFIAAKYNKIGNQISLLIIFLGLIIFLVNLKSLHFAARNQTFRAIFICFFCLLQEIKFRREPFLTLLKPT